MTGPMESQSALSLSAQSDLNSIRNLEGKLNQLFVQQREAIRMMILSVLTGEHMLMLSRTGSAKSAMVRGLFSNLEGSRFQHQCTVDDRSSRYFGPLNAVKYAQTGEYVRPNEGFLQHANWAFFDEIFDSSDQVLRMLLQALNERIFEEDNGKAQKIDLKSAFAAANYLRLNEVTEAVIDRFMFARLLKGELTPADLLQVDLLHRSKVYDKEPSSKLSIAQVDVLRGHVEQTIVPSEVLYLKNLALRRFVDNMNRKLNGQITDDSKKFRVSPRRAVNMTRVLQANAFLNQRGSAGLTDLRALEQCVGASYLEHNPGGVMKESVDSVLSQFSSAEAEAQLTLIGALIDKRPLPNLSDFCQKVRLEVMLPKVCEDPVRFVVTNMQPVNSDIAALRDMICLT